jgi:hypothetical protein
MSESSTPAPEPEAPVQSQPEPQPEQPSAFTAPPVPLPAPLPVPQPRVGLGILAGVAAMAAGALVYGTIMAKTDHEVGLVALLVGALVGAALGKVGGRSPVLPVVGVALGVFGVFAGQMLGGAMWISDYTNGVVSTTSVFTDHFGDLFDAWKEDFDIMSAVFFAIAGFEGFVITKRLAG